MFFHIKYQMKMLLERQGTVQKGLKLQKKVHKPPFGVNVIHFEINGFNAFIWVPQTPRSYNALIEVFKFIWDVKTPIRSDPYLSQSHQDWGLWTFSSKVAECGPCVVTSHRDYGHTMRCFLNIFGLIGQIGQIGQLSFVVF